VRGRSHLSIARNNYGGLAETGRGLLLHGLLIPERISRMASSGNG
jgi:hypothetical protein